MRKNKPLKGKGSSIHKAPAARKSLVMKLKTGSGNYKELKEPSESEKISNKWSIEETCKPRLVLIFL